MPAACEYRPFIGARLHGGATLSFLRDYLSRVNRSFAAVYQLLERPRAAQRAVVGLLTMHTALLGYSAYVHSPTLNEPGHLVAGLSIWKFGRFDVYSVNPPVVKMVAALPVMAAGYEEDWSAFYTGPSARPEFAMGKDFVAANGERSFFLFMIARWACIPFSWIGAIVCYLWARDLFGRPSGVVACAIWCFEPNILAHASLITPDAHATALGVAACYTFWRWLKKPTWSQAALTGVVLGLAELAKTTLILFYPLWPAMWVGYRLMERRASRVACPNPAPSVGEAPNGAESGRAPQSSREALEQATLGESGPPWPGFPMNRNHVSERLGRMWLREGGMLALRMVIGLYVLNLGYGFERALRPLGEFRFVSEMFTGTESGVRDQKSEGQASLQSAIQNPKSPNRFAGTWFANVPSPFPKDYLAGIDLQQRDFEHYGRSSYLRGEWRDHGWWHYYLYALMIKVPIGLWALGTLAIATRTTGSRARASRSNGEVSKICLEDSVVIREAPHTGHLVKGRRPSGRGRDLLILLSPPTIFFFIVSFKTGMNEHVRYVLPCFPFIFIAISAVLRSPVDVAIHGSVKCEHSATLKSRRATWFPVVLLLVWFVASSCWVYPHSLSYFNESIGGPYNGPRHLLGSSVDWGQDLRYLKSWIDENDLGLIRIVPRPSYDPRDVGILYPSFDPNDHRLAFPQSRSASRQEVFAELSSQDARRGVAILGVTAFEALRCWATVDGNSTSETAESIRRIRPRRLCYTMIVVEEW